MHQTAILDARSHTGGESASMLRRNLPDEQVQVRNTVTDLIVRYRVALWVFLGLLFAISFNGRWRIGLDSAIYRGLAANLSTGNGFVFGEWASRQVYPGLPVMLAGINWLCDAPPDATFTNYSAFEFVGPRIDTAISVLVIALMGAATVVLSYKLIRLYYPQWMAICVGFGVGINAWFMQLSNEILTDVPFMLGVMMSLYGWELLQRARRKRQWVIAMLFVAPGLLLASSMRPTFWVLAVVWAVVCAWGIIRGPRRLFHFSCIVVLALAWLTVRVTDPSPRGLDPLAGGYEREAIELLPDAPVTFGQRLFEALHDQLPAAFFGEQMSPLGIPFSLLLLGSCVLLFRRHVMWGLLVCVTFAITLVLSTQARYYTIVLPFLLLAWLLMLLEIVKRVSARRGAVVLFVGLGLVTCNNLSALVGLIQEQRSGSRFLHEYKNGRTRPLVTLSDLMLEKLPADARVLGPTAPMLAYMTGLRVYSEREIIPHGAWARYPAALREREIRYAVFPAALYRAKDPITARLIERGLLVVTKHLGSIDGQRLARIRVHVPAENWRTLPKGWEPPAAKPKRHGKT